MEAMKGVLGGSYKDRTVSNRSKYIMLLEAMKDWPTMRDALSDYDSTFMQQLRAVGKIEKALKASLQTEPFKANNVVDFRGIEKGRNVKHFIERLTISRAFEKGVIKKNPDELKLNKPSLEYLRLSFKEIGAFFETVFDPGNPKKEKIWKALLDTYVDNKNSSGGDFSCVIGYEIEEGKGSLMGLQVAMSLVPGEKITENDAQKPSKIDAAKDGLEKYLVLKTAIRGNLKTGAHQKEMQVDISAEVQAKLQQEDPDYDSYEDLKYLFQFEIKKFLNTSTGRQWLVSERGKKWYVSLGNKLQGKGVDPEFDKDLFTPIYDTAEELMKELEPEPEEKEEDPKTATELFGTEKGREWLASEKGLSFLTKRRGKNFLKEVPTFPTELQDSLKAFVADNDKVMDTIKDVIQGEIDKGRGKGYEGVVELLGIGFGEDSEKDPEKMSEVFRDSLSLKKIYDGYRASVIRRRR
jgi:hypothetical protein